MYNQTSTFWILFRLCLPTHLGRWGYNRCVLRGESGGMEEWRVALTDLEPGQRTDASGSLRRPEEADNRNHKANWSL